MANLYNLAKMTTATTGTGTITLGSAVDGFLTFALAGVSDGDIVPYTIVDGSNTEHGVGTYTASGTTLTRTVRKSTNSDAAISLSGSAEVFITAGSADVGYPVYVSGTYTAKAGEIVHADTSGGAFTVTLPASPIEGDKVTFIDEADWGTNNLTIGRNGETIDGDAADLVCNIGGVYFSLVYNGSDWTLPKALETGGGTGATLTGTETLTNKTIETNNNTVTVDGEEVGFRNVPVEDPTGAHTLATTDVGRVITADNTQTIPNSTFSPGDVVTIYNATASDITLTCSITTAYIAGTNTDVASATLPLGLSSSFVTKTGDQGTNWVQETVDLSAYAGHTIRLVWRVVIGTADTVFQNDVQLDTIAFDGNSYNFDTDDESFQTAEASISLAYGSATFGAIQNSNTDGYWCRDTGETPSSGTGTLTAQGGTHYLYTETSSPVQNDDVFWLRSPSIVVGSTPGNCTYYYGMDITGASTTLDFYVDVEAQP